MLCETYSAGEPGDTLVILAEHLVDDDLRKLARISNKARAYR